MPQIIVTARDRGDLQGTVMLRERINTSDFESDRFIANLLERIGWAVSDAAEAEERDPDPEPQEAKDPETERELVKA